MQQRWGAPVQVPMAMMYQESSFKHDALPPRYYFLGFIPWGRVSSAYGYAQAKDETWADYKREAGGWGASRDDFADALDFMGWYIQKSQRVNGVSMGRLRPVPELPRGLGRLPQPQLRRQAMAEERLAEGPVPRLAVRRPVPQLPAGAVARRLVLVEPSAHAAGSNLFRLRRG